MNLTELAKEKGFHGHFPKEWKHNTQEPLRYYFWMCELQKWLRDTHKMDLYMSNWGPTGEFYHIEDIVKDSVVIGNGGKGSVIYEEALEEGLLAALKLIK